MTEKIYKCFLCGKMYEDEESAIRCHNMPVQKVQRNEKLPKPRFLGN